MFLHSKFDACHCLIMALRGKALRAQTGAMDFRESDIRQPGPQVEPLWIILTSALVGTGPVQRRATEGDACRYE